MFQSSPFVVDGVTYVFSIPKFRLPGTHGICESNKLAVDTSDDAKLLRASLVAQAWEGKYGRREESEFEANGFIKVLYTAPEA